MAATVRAPIGRPQTILFPVRLARVAAPPVEVPSATCRLQFRKGFGFRQARLLAPYLQSLGITHIYASPIFLARAGSEHGYDVTDPRRLDPALGSEEEFNAFTSELNRRGMGLILDVVPNHMAADAENEWWESALEDGPRSPFARFFDIDWKGVDRATRGRLVLPTLGAPYGEVLEKGELRLALDERGLHVRYWERRFPVKAASYSAVLSFRFPAWKQKLGPHHRAVLAVEEVVAAIDELSRRKGHSRFLLYRAVKRQLWEAYCTEPELREFLDANLCILSGAPGDPSSFDALDRLLSEQHYLLAYWRTAIDRVNYRRFFDISDLAALRAEDEEVFGATHALLMRLVNEGRVSGVRVDHVDGLYDPDAYLRRLAESLPPRQRGRRPYVIAEKILLDGEKLPRSWELSGTTGYDFLNAVNGVFVDRDNLDRLDAIYKDFSGVHASFEELAYAQKKKVMHQLFAGELRRLSVRLETLAARDRWARAGRLEDFAAAIEEVTARLRVYRTYVRSYEIPASDRGAIASAFDAVSWGTAMPPGPAFSFLRRVLLLEAPDGASPAERERWLRFVMAWQQFTGPVMAKAVEDTAYYIYNRLISLNVVGGCSSPCSAAEFHRFNQERCRVWPYSMNATSTHDTKRSEDVRARINTLSEIPEAWRERLARWRALNAPHKTIVDGCEAPDANDEILLYQVLLGAWPLSGEDLPEFRERVRGFAVKAAREAKTHTNWIAPHAGYEAALCRFLDALLDPESAFLKDFLPFQRFLAPFGAVGSLAQALLKAVSPGVPDFYQSAMLWDFSLVDPDNRRPVDFERQMSLFRAMEERPPFTEELVENWQDGRIKLFTIARALEFRRRRRGLFLSGDYQPVEVCGPAARHIVAFARRAGDDWALAVVPRLLVELCGDRPAFSPEVWAGSYLQLPEDAPRRWRNVFTGDSVEGPRIAAQTLFERFPVALLGAY